MAVYYYWKLIAKQVDSNGDGFTNDELFKNYDINGVTYDVRDTFLQNENDPSQSTFMSIGSMNESNYDDTVGKYKFKQEWGGNK